MFILTHIGTPITVLFPLLIGFYYYFSSLFKCTSNIPRKHFNQARKDNTMWNDFLPRSVRGTVQDKYDFIYSIAKNKQLVYLCRNINPAERYLCECRRVRIQCKLKNEIHGIGTRTSNIVFLSTFITIIEIISAQQFSTSG